jgi:glutamine---fructose-6-phosphate transaminase (isomerizing)
MCGITGCIGKCNCFDHLLNGLKQLQNRGYDSAGICTISEHTNTFSITKCASSEKETAIAMLSKTTDDHCGSHIGIGHTRWATHGPKTDVNAHPHADMFNEFTLVHNGIIENYQALKDFLVSNGYTFKSETDTEVIVNLISYEYKYALKVETSIFLSKNPSFLAADTTKSNFEQQKSSIFSDEKKSILVKNAIMTAISKLTGTYALCILSLHCPTTLYCIRSGSPLLIGLTETFAMVTSEKSAFEDKFTNYYVIDNNNLCILTLNDGKVEFTSENPQANKNLSVVSDKSDGLGDFSHWTEKEIYEQIQSSMRAITNGGRLKSDLQVRLGGLENANNIKELSRLEHIILLGCGTSYHAGLIASHFFKQFCNFNTVQVIDGAELNEDDIPKHGKTGFILLSQSGETRDLYRCIEIGRSKNIYLIGVVNVVDSLIAREVDCGVYLNAGREVAVASTKSFTSQLIVLLLMSLWFSQQHEMNKINTKARVIKDLRNIDNSITKTLEVSKVACDQVVKLFDNFSSCFLLGKGTGEGIAKEGALKIKEISYIHAEGYSASALKHGPFALLKRDFPVIIIALNDKHFDKCINAMIEIKSRGAKIILITNVNPSKGKDKGCLLEGSLKHADYVIQLPSEAKWIGEILSIIPIQMLAYKLALSRELNPDLPRNLAKVVTVD